MSADAAVVPGAWARRPVRPGLLVSSALAVLGLSACGTASRLAVSVETRFHDPVDAAEVSVEGSPARSTTDAEGTAVLTGIRPGVHHIVVSARGYYTAELQTRLRPHRDAVIELSYRPPPGTFDFFDSGPDRLDWTQAVITAFSVTTTEYDWTCAPAAGGHRLLGHWETFAVAPPAAIAPDTIAPGWVRRPAVTNPPPPPSGCSPPGGTRVVPTPPWLG